MVRSPAMHPAAALDDIQRLRHCPFGVGVSAFVRAEAARRAGVKGCTPHVFRHTAAVWMAEDGVPMAKIAALLGHADASITERVYAKFSPDNLREASASLEMKILK